MPTISLRVTTEQRDYLQAIADKETNGNISAAIHNRLGLNMHPVHERLRQMSETLDFILTEVQK